MIYIGTDIVNISRIVRMIDDKGQRFLSHVFTHCEQSFCNSKAIPHIHYGGKFAAKEAVKKALLSSKSFKNISLKSIEIQNDDSGVPVINLNSKNITAGNINVSISHAGDYAIAMAILEI